MGRRRRICGAAAIVAMCLSCMPPPDEPGPGVVRLTTTGARNGQPSFSPDGSRIAFVSDRDGDWQVWSMPATGGPARRLTEEPGPVGWPTWTPRGDTVLFYGRREGRYGLLRLDLTTGAVGLLDERDGDAFRPIAHPEGHLLLFDAVAPDSDTGHDLHVRDRRTGVDRSLTADGAYDSDARWSPDGSRIAFHSDQGQPEPLHVQIHVMRVDGTDRRQLTEGAARNAYPAWSPDGRCLAYTSELGGNRDLWVMGADGADPVRLTTWEGLDSEPVWSPDGAYVLFATDRFGGVELALLRVSDTLRERCAFIRP